MRTPPALAGGTHGADALRPLLETVLTALAAGAAARPGPLPAGGPAHTAATVRAAVGDLLPDKGDPQALATITRALAEGSADPAHPHCAAHLHCPPLAVATAADLAASALNPSMDSWDQAPAASVVEHLLTRTLAAEVYPATHPDAPADALVTTGGTESNQLAALLARERRHPRIVHGANTHHSVPRAAWLLGLPAPVAVPTPTGTLDPAALHDALTALHGEPALVVATAGTTDAGLIDPLPAIADICAAHHARLHVDAAYGGGLLLSNTPARRALLDGLDRAHTVTLDLHKLGWQPVAAGLLAVRDPADLTALHQQADYLNADDDTEAGLPDLLGRSLRTSRRPDALKAAVTLKTLGRHQLGELVDTVCASASVLADLVEAHPRFALHRRPTLSTVLFRPLDPDGAPLTDDDLAAVRRTLLHQGRAVLGRARADGRRWLKATLLNPRTTPGDLAALLALVEGTTPR
ncbi:pyridoxal phosphate-dependent decarboxylase family protein [Streptomyces sp. NPDC060194]|uniref:pyridoxal phosphate-dependent decarboxylase family protein n=1 Tax=Streptomyces sp. NPDC060194 TaxID=3347069 RepID=UPI00365D6E38